MSGGHDDLVELLVSHGAHIEHRDKKGCTPLILAASAGAAISPSPPIPHLQSPPLSYHALVKHACTAPPLPPLPSPFPPPIHIFSSPSSLLLSPPPSPLLLPPPSPPPPPPPAGHSVTVGILLDHAADIEAQSDRTKDTALSLACSGGRQEVCTITSSYIRVS